MTRGTNRQHAHSLGGPKRAPGNASPSPTSSPVPVHFMDARFKFLALLLLLMMFDAHSVAVLGWKGDPTAFSKANTRRRLLVSHGRNPCCSGVSKCTTKSYHLHLLPVNVTIWLIRMRYQSAEMTR